MGGGPKRNKKKNKFDEDEEDEKFTSSKSKWAEALEEKQLEDADPEQLYSKPTKEIYEYDFSKQNLLYTQQKKAPVQRDKYADFTPQQLEELKRIKQIAKIDKQAKNKLKNEKRKQRKKEADAQKEKQAIQKAKELEQQKRIQEEVEKTKKEGSSPWVIPVVLFSFLIIMSVLQYNEQIYVKLAKFRKDDVDYYEALEIDQGATDHDIKQKYKKLVLKYHPDRNPNCQNCKEKFDKIMEAWEILGDPQKRQNYDRNSGVISEIKSSSITLTPKNYNYLVEESTKIWMIQVYDSTSGYSRYFNEFWEDIIKEYEDIVNFGRIDSWHQSDMLSYIPYRFQVFPGLYILDHGYSQICSMDLQKPMLTIRRCIEEHLQKIEIPETKELPSPQILKDQIINTQKLPVKLSLKLRNSPRIKAINLIYSEYFQFYFIDDKSSTRSATIYRNKPDSVNQLQSYEFLFADSTKKSFKKYSEFLEAHIIQKLSLCHFLQTCGEKKCMIVLNETYVQKAMNHLPLSEGVPTIIIRDEVEQIVTQIEKVKQSMGVAENFEIGLYQDGKIDLGYVDEVGHLDSGVGQMIDFECRVKSWSERGIEWVQSWIISFNSYLD